MTTIRIKLEELETVAEHVPDAEDACQRARTSLSWEFPSLVMKISGISTAAIDSLKDELIHWLDRYEEKLNEAEELLYRTAAAISQADQTLADNMKEFGLELLGWYDLQRVFGEYAPVTGERLSFGDRLFAGGMLLLSVIPPAKGAGIAGKAGIKGAKAAGIVADVSKWISKTKNVLYYDKIKSFFQTIYHQVIKGPITETIRSFRKQWENFLENVGAVLRGPQLAADGVGVVPSGRMIGIAEESASSVRISMSQAGDGVIGKGTGGVAKGTSKFTYNNLPKNPKELMEDGWKDVTPDGMRKNTNSREYEDPRTGIRVRFDPGKPGAPGFEGKDHYHIYNPNRTGKGDYYLDKNGNPVPKGSKASHILP
ncbi:pre-toxin TG domain-containing protein [Parageobacillus thermoglucosidasius]|uniref:Pre-toxin TG domain-containing protein n=1 Tax=Parageobacillus thermoglucosidasius TaxID=1426 RepID=A0AB38QZA1_PARTM|nr:pre-toxin TG domain-containing protein [Parageobacillus thermoglucosidasius]UOE76683.1 pre-toxin TG domain-containing protein [Parageobacillus thermoglucosidasius]